jgi:hypothetical protein
MSEKPQKRLVSKGQYAWSMTGRALLLSMCILFSLFGVYSLVVTGWTLYTNVSVFDVGLLCLTFMNLLFTGGSFFFACCLWEGERGVERVVPITKRTTGTLPPEAETLVRASDLPPSDQQAELLRAAQFGKETSAEELLRATQKRM